MTSWMLLPLTSAALVSVCKFERFLYSLQLDTEINLYLENPPQDQTERWSGRPFRSLSVIIPPGPINLDPTQTQSEKQRFLENLWKAQANYRARAGQSVVLCADDQEVESRSGRTTIARTYFNVYQRTAFLQEAKKVCKCEGFCHREFIDKKF